MADSRDCTTLTFILNFTACSILLVKLLFIFRNVLSIGLCKLILVSDTIFLCVLKAAFSMCLILPFVFGLHNLFGLSPFSLSLFVQVLFIVFTPFCVSAPGDLNIYTKCRALNLTFASTELFNIYARIVLNKFDVRVTDFND